MPKNLFGGVQTTTPSYAPQVAASNSLVTAPLRSMVALKPFDTKEIMTLGAKAQSSIPAATSKITAMARSSDMDEMGKLLLDTVSMAKGYDPTSMESKGFFSKLLGKAINFKDRFDTVDKSVQQLVKQIETKNSLFIRRIDDLDAMKNQLYKDYVDLEQEIIGIIARCDWMDANPPVVDMSNPMEVAKLDSWKMVSGMARKRADDLQRLRLLFEQQAVQIDQMKSNSAALAMDMSDMRSTTIPALQSTFAIFIMSEEQRKGAEFSQSMKKTTNDAITKAADAMGRNTVAIATAISTSNIELSTLQHSKDAIINSIQERERILTEAKLRLRNEAPQLEQLSRDLATSLAS